MEVPVPGVCHQEEGITMFPGADTTTSSWGYDFPQGKFAMNAMRKNILCLCHSQPPLSVTKSCLDDESSRENLEFDLIQSCLCVYSRHQLLNLVPGEA